MKSSRQNIDTRDVATADPIMGQIKKEKEALVSMFLANATITELAAQYKVIDDLSARMKIADGR